MTPEELLRDLREAGLEVEADGDVLRVRGPRSTVEAARSRLTFRKPEILAALRREEIERLLDLAPVDPATGLPDLPADEPATTRQVRRLRELAADPALAPHRERVREIVEDALERGLSQLAAWGLLGKLGRRISKRQRAGCGGGP